MILGRIILLTEGEVHSIIKQKWLTKIFVIGDIVSFIMQGGGMFQNPPCSYAKYLKHNQVEVLWHLEVSAP